MSRRGIRRRSGKRLVPTERDLDLLVLTGRVRYLAVDQIAQTLFPSQDRARRRVRDLFDAGLVAITIIASNVAAVVSLTKQGLALAASAHPELASSLALAGPIRLAGVAHHLAIVSVRLALALWMHEASDPLVEWANARGGLAGELGFHKLGLEPDGVALLESGAVIAVEVDLGTMGRETLTRKFRKYATPGEVVPSELWLVYEGGARRGETLRALIVDAGLAEVTRLIRREATLVRPLGERPDVVARGGAADPVGLKTAARGERNTERVQSVRNDDPDADGRADRGADGWGSGRPIHKRNGGSR